MEAQHEDEDIKHIYGLKTIITKRGDCIKSLETWAERWHWSKSSVSRFLRVLSDNGYIRYANETITVRVTVCNYDLYQGERNGNGTHVKRTRNARETHAGTDNNVNNDKNDKNVYGEHVLLTESQYNKLIDKYGIQETQRMIDSMNEYAGMKPKKFKEYADHYLTLLNWKRRDEEKNQQQKQHKQINPDFYR